MLALSNPKNLTIAINILCFIIIIIDLFGKVSKTLEEFDVEERPASVLEEKFPNLTVIHCAVKSLHTQSHASFAFYANQHHMAYMTFYLPCSHSMLFHV